MALISTPVQSALFHILFALQFRLMTPFMFKTYSLPFKKFFFGCSHSHTRTQKKNVRQRAQFVLSFLMISKIPSSTQKGKSSENTKLNWEEGLPVTWITRVFSSLLRVILFPLVLHAAQNKGSNKSGSQQLLDSTWHPPPATPLLLRYISSTRGRGRSSK